MFLLADCTDLLNAFTAICALFVSVLSLGLTLWSLQVQRQHNRLSVKPVVSFPLSNYENEVAIKLKNSGVGPLFVTRMEVTDGKETKPNVIRFMPKLPGKMLWASYVEGIDGRCIPAEDSATLIRLTGDASKQEFREAREAVRQALSKLTIRVEYKDIYDREMEPVEKSLSWFGEA